MNFTLKRTLFLLLFISSCKDQIDIKSETALKYYGYYWVESGSYGSHINECSDYTNLNWVERIDDVQVCAELNMQSILQVRWQFFIGGECQSGEGVNPLRSDYQHQWNILAETIEPFIDHISAFYMIDEPYWNCVNESDLNTAIEIVKDTYPKIPVMVVFAYPSMNESLTIPENADWIGFDHYELIEIVEEDLSMLKNAMHSHQKIFLVPQSFLNASINSDEVLARLNNVYYDLAMSDTTIIGMLNFGLWTHEDPSNIQKTLETQIEIGNNIIGE